MQTPSSLSHTLSPQPPAREDFRSACREPDFGQVFRLMRKYDGVSQDAMPAPIAGLTQISTVDVMEQIADARAPAPQPLGAGRPAR